jgi:hypothetical protein
VLEPIWNTKPETASRVRGRIESIIDWATARGYRRGENPAHWRGHLENLLSVASVCSWPARIGHSAPRPVSRIAIAQPWDRTILARPAAISRKRWHASAGAQGEQQHGGEEEAHQHRPPPGGARAPAASIN